MSDDLCAARLAGFRLRGATTLADFGPWDAPMRRRSLVEVPNPTCVLPAGHSGWHRTEAGPDGLQWENLS